MQARIDYLKLQMPANNGETMPLVKSKWETWWEGGEHVGLNAGGALHFNNVYDGKGNWYVTVDISGPQANIAFYTLDAHELNFITRLDYRTELDTSLDVRTTDDVMNLMRSLNTMRRNIGRGTARPRSKTDKRDGGGERAFVGSLKSVRYLAVYTKPGEGTAVEYKLSGAPLAQLIKSCQRANKELGWDLRSLLTRIWTQVQADTDEYMRKVVGMDVYDFNQWAVDQMEGRTQNVVEVHKHAIMSAFNELNKADRREVLHQLALDIQFMKSE